MRNWLTFGLIALLLPGIAMAQDRIALSRAIYKENLVATSGLRTIEPASELRRGDRVVMMIEWSGAEARRGTVVRSAVPSALAYQRSSADTVEVSVDGGRSWGRIGSLRTGGRLAAPEEVTHLRLRVSGTSAGRLTYSAIVR